MHTTTYITIAFLLIITTIGDIHEPESRSANTIINDEKINDPSKPYKGYLFFEIHTADEEGAGTDSDIYITVVGMKNNLTRKALRSIGPSMNAFERNQVDVCMIYSNVTFDATDNIVQGIELINEGQLIGSGKFSNSIVFFLL